MLDMRTALLAYVLCHAICLVFIASLWSARRQSIAGLDDWLKFYGLNFLGLLLVAFRGSLPGAVSVGLADPLSALGVFFLLAGVHKFVGREAPFRSNALLLVAFISAHTYLTFVRPDGALRDGLFALFVVYMGAQGIYWISRQQDPAEKQGARFSGWVLLAIAILGAARFALHTDAAAPGPQGAPSSLDVIGLLGYACLLVTLTFSIFLAVSQRLFATLQADTEARVAVEEALRESEYFFRESQRAAAVGSYKTDFGSGTWTSSEVLDQIFGIGPEYRRDIQGWLQLVHPDDRVAMEDYLSSEVIGAGHPFRKEYRILRRSDGATRWVIGHGQLQKDAAGRVRSMIGTIQDITVRKTDELERGRLLTAIEQADDAIVITDTNGAIQYVNPAFERASGYRSEEVLGQNPRVLKSGVQDESYYRALWETISAGKTWKGRLVNRRKDGSFFNEMAVISPVRADGGRIVSFVAVKHDTTEQTALEAQLAQAQKMESVGRLAGGVAHDFNNMLCVILGYADRLLLGLGPADPLRGDLEEIRMAAERSANLTQQLLAFARKQPVAPKVLDLNETLKGMLNMLKRLLGEGVHLEWRPGARLDQVRLDPSQVDQVLANLCVNARDAIGATGNLTITTEMASPEELERLPGLASLGPYVKLEVRDNGCGMDRATLAHIFEPFYTTKDLGKGTGLGLATVYGIVKQNAGYITVESEPGCGSAFKVFLPGVSGGRGVAIPKPDGSEAIDGQEWVLLVEDEPALLRITKQMLESQGYHVLAASDAEKALQLADAQACHVHLLVTDVILPVMNGGELAKRIHRKFPGMKCLYISGYTAEIITPHGVLEPGVHFLQKPFTASMLASKVREAIDAPALG